MSTTVLASLALLFLIGYCNASNANDCTQCPLLPAATSSIGMLLLAGNKIWYVHQRYGPPVVAKKCWSSSMFLNEFNIAQNAMNVNWTFYDPK
nr:unnamed protein product [Callosobruchus analis]